MTENKVKEGGNLIKTDNKLHEIAYIIEPLDGSENLDEKLAEIKALIESADAEVYSFSCQTIREITPATYIGSGKLEEIRQIIDGTSVNLAVFDGELSPSQTLNISSALDDVKVIDRTTLILDIFARNAKSTEGKLQVELAQLKYIYPRLKGKGSALSRLGGGIGTRGPGESQLETDRRHIRRRIDNLENQLKELENRRKMQTDRRDRNNMPTVALVGYTNTGKSTLMNALTDAGVYVENRLFATLDPTVRKLKLDSAEVLLVDTVGFVQNIPHHIIEAFKSTLELAATADLILNVCDASGTYAEQLETTLSTLADLKAQAPIITIYNKCDCVSDFSAFPKDALLVSAEKKINLDCLLNKINDYFSSNYISVEFTIPYEKFGELAKLEKYMSKKEYTYNDDSVKAEITFKKLYADKFTQFKTPKATR